MRGKIGDGLYAVGTAVKDAQYMVVGKDDTPLCFFGLRVGKRDDGSAIFVNCKAWRKLAGISRSIGKGDPVLVMGKMENSTGKDGKEYQNLVAEFICNAALMDITPDEEAPEYAANSNGFEELPQGESDELPF